MNSIGASIIKLPTAAAEPVVNPKRTGRYPKGSNVAPRSRLSGLRWQRDFSRRMANTVPLHAKAAVVKREAGIRTRADVIAELHLFIDLQKRQGDHTSEFEKDRVTGRIYRLTCELEQLGRAVQ